MRILAIYPNEQGYGRLPLGLAILITILLENGHEVELFDTTFVMQSDNIDNVVREKAKLVIPIEKSNLYEAKSCSEIDEMFNKRIFSFRPELVIASILEENYQYANRLLSLVKDFDKNIPVCVGGSTPSIAPHVVIENPNIDYLIQGEGEEALLEFCTHIQQGLSIENVKNIWYKKNGSIYHNSLRPFINLDDLPMTNFDQWDDRHFLKPYNGRMYKAGFFELSRGCPNVCSYCINETYHRLLSEAGHFFRQKSIDKVIAEMKLLKDLKNIEMILFCDDNFLMMSDARLQQFSELYQKEVNLPYWINTTPESINQYRLSILKHTGCCGIGMGIETGNEWLRINILKKRTTNEALMRSFDLVHQAGIRTTANNMIGFPGEYEADIFETVKFNQLIAADSCDLNFVAPYIGTTIHAISIKLGYIDVMEEPGFRGMARNVSSRLGPVIHNPHISRERYMEIYYNFMDYVEGRLPIPDQYLVPAPGSGEEVPLRGELSIEAIKAMASVVSSLHKC